MLKLNLQIVITGLSEEIIYADIWPFYECLTYCASRTIYRQKAFSDIRFTTFRIPYLAYSYLKPLNRTIITCYRKRLLPGINTRFYKNISI
jgi:hypothetical protein